MKQIAIYFLLFIIYSFVGWIGEVCLALIKEKKFINRGFLIGPYCPIYGVGCILITLCLQSFASNPFILFIMSLIICSGLEYSTSYIMEKLFKARWWDYSNYKFNINGRICLQYMLAFGILGTVIIYIINPYLITLFNKVSPNVLYIITIILVILFFMDNIISFKIIYTFKNTFIKVARDNTDEINQKVHAILLEKTGLAKRLRKAFPNLQVKLNKTKKKIEKEVKKIKKKLDSK